ncbi:MAG: diguanylate cyclase/phosphodiesterase (GGDEF & EAL domains) with PAS/PAC sensor(s) [uncultured Thiotrichaceae bacterium]|uniref:Diguanylate cyclase/phosphodiesterase (GGDEF & EAL domains) with PAS/PAC sensor(S) n=1 Tax=uncultured Thiotrichaceae bacterium TaxID=298394 RepID=A0A6S6TTV6_9GAMM|nr:MAG: diguanylate cyclase/phosphodiesterase (GGDEF & EAL domains) with PAS/PAC sensor(s) [uncultured Thiotrichaceae bacterium]
MFSKILFFAVSFLCTTTSLWAGISSSAGSETAFQQSLSESLSHFTLPIVALSVTILAAIAYKSFFIRNKSEVGRTHLSVSNQKISASPDTAVIRINKDLNIEYCNPQTQQVYEKNEEDILNQSLDDFLLAQGISAHETQEIQHLVKRQLKDAIYGLVYGELSIPRKNKVSSFQVSTSPILNEKNKVVGVALFAEDHAEQKRLMAKLIGQAERDHLTGLINRMGFDKFLEEFPASSRPGAKNVICYMDLDNFKPVNDSAGHSAGDELLKQLSDIFRQHVRSSDLLARTGGDEFVILFPNCPMEKARARMENIINSVSSFRFSWGDKSFVVGVSIGAVEFDSEVSSAAINDLCKIADEACYTAKQKGRNQLYIHDASHSSEKSEHMGKDNWHIIIREALDHNTFELFVQPILALNSADADKRKRFEIYLRLPFNGRTLRPGSFFPAAERHGLSNAIDRWVVNRTMEKVAELNEKDGVLTSREFTINISGASLSDEDFGDFIQSELNKHGLSANTLCFEVSESDVVSNFLDARKLLIKLAALGCSNSLDDFGSGLSALSYIRDLPIHYLKIDGVFVRNIETNQIDAAMIHSLNHMSKVMNLKTIAEFVEDEETAKLLRRLGVDYAQGYYCGRPMPLERLEAAKVAELS